MAFDKRDAACAIRTTKLKRYCTTQHASYNHHSYERQYSRIRRDQQLMSRPRIECEQPIRMVNEQVGRESRPQARRDRDCNSSSNQPARCTLLRS